MTNIEVCKKYSNGLFVCTKSKRSSNSNNRIKCFLLERVNGKERRSGVFFTIDKKTNEVLLNDCYGADKHIQKIINVLMGID